MIDTTRDALQGMLAAELAFMDAYEQAIPKVLNRSVRQELEECQRSHHMRADILREELEDLGYDVDPYARDVGIQLGTPLGEDAAIARLAILEAHAMRLYREASRADDFDIRDLIEGDLIPEQERTDAILSGLRAEI